MHLECVLFGSVSHPAEGPAFSSHLITSNLGRSRAPGNVALKKGDANLPKASVVNVTQVLTVDKSELVERIGKLPARAVEAVGEGLNLLFARTLANV